MLVDRLKAALLKANARAFETAVLPHGSPRVVHAPQTPQTPRSFCV